MTVYVNIITYLYKETRTLKNAYEMLLFFHKNSIIYKNNIPIAETFRGFIINMAVK